MRRYQGSKVGDIEDDIRSGAVTFADLVRGLRIPIAISASSVALIMMFVLVSCPVAGLDIAIVTIACSWIASFIAGVFLVSVWYELVRRGYAE